MIKSIRSEPFHQSVQISLVLNKREDGRTFRAWSVVTSLPSEHAALVKLRELMNRCDSPGIWENWSSPAASRTE